MEAIKYVLYRLNQIAKNVARIPIGPIWILWVTGALGFIGSPIIMTVLLSLRTYFDEDVRSKDLVLFAIFLALLFLSWFPYIIYCIQ